MFKNVLSKLFIYLLPPLELLLLLDLEELEVPDDRLLEPELLDTLLELRETPELPELL